MKPFVLVTGCSRSGTTLLSSLLETCLDIAIPVATMWLAHFSRWLYLWGDAERYENRLYFLAAVESYLRQWRRTLAKEPERLAGYTMLPIIEKYGNELCEQYSSWDSMLIGMYQRFAAEYGRSFYGEKNSTFPYLGEIDRTIPGIRVVHIVRDGRDVCLSWCKESFGPATTAEAGWRWAGQIRHSRAWAKQNPDRYLEIRYADLLRDTPAVISEIAAFLGIPVVRPPETKSEGKIGGMAAALMNPKLSGPILKENSGWAHRMSPRDLRVFESVAGVAMRDVGLQTVTERSHWRSNVSVIQDVGRSIVSPSLYRLTARSVLPCALRLSQHIRRPTRL